MDQLSFVFVVFVTVTVTLALAAPSDSMTVKIREECKKLPGPPAQLVRFWIKTYFKGLIFILSEKIL